MTLGPGDVVGGRWRIDRHVDRGGMGVVHLGTDLAGGGRVAIKVLLADDARARARFEREAQLLAGLDHPAIVRYLDHGVAATQPWLVMEWIEGPTLAERIRGRGLTTTEAVTAVRRAAEALGAGHRRGLVHRDVKPRNLLLPGDDPARLVVIDFGVARRIDASPELTATGAVVGTPAYVAPELARHGGEPDPRADVFGLGCVLYECLTGRPAFAGGGVWAVLTRVLLDEPPPVRALAPQVSAELEALVARMLAKDPAARPADGDAVLGALAALPALADARVPPVAAGTEPLTGDEQRLVAVVLAAAAGVAWSPETLAADDDPFATAADGAAPGALAAIAGAHGARLDRLLGGPVALVLDGEGAAHDRAAVAARCALAVRAAWPGAAVALALGHARAHGAIVSPVGDAIDRAAAGLVSGGAGVAVDAVIAGLLEARFVVEVDPGGAHRLLGARARPAPRLLLGRPAPLVGRDRELAMLRAALAGDRDQATVLLISGPPGAGKSRLLAEVLAGAGDWGTPWIARAEALAAGAPLALAAHLIRGGDDDVAAARARVAAVAHRRLAATDAARVAGFLGELIGAAPPADDPAAAWLAAARRDVRAMADQLRAAFVDWVRAAAHHGPLLIAIEDLHWGDRASVGLLDAALAAAGDAPLAVIATARPEVHAAFPGLWAGRGLQEIRLGPLPRRACERLVRGALGDDLAAPVVDRVVAQSDGNPLFLEELVRAVAAGVTELPGTVLAMVGARLATLEPELRRVLRAASILGERAPTAGVAALLGDPTDAVERALGFLVAREVLVPDEPARRFRHALLRDAAYATLTDDDRRRGHRLAAAWLEANPAAAAPVIAEHHERADDRARAARWWGRAADGALERGDLGGAVDASRRGLAAAAGSAEDTGALWTLQIEALRWSGDFAATAAAAAAALEVLPRGGAAWCGAAQESMRACHRTGRRDRLLEVAAAVATVVGAAPPAPALLRTAFQAADHLLRVGARAPAAALLARADHAADGVDDPLVAASRAEAHAMQARYDGDPEAVRGHAAAALAAYGRAGDRRRALAAAIALADAEVQLGDAAAVDAPLTEAIALAGRLGATSLAALARLNLGLGRHTRGQHAVALADVAAARAAAAAAGNHDLEGFARTYEAAILLALGRADDAIAAARDAVRLLQHAPARAQPLAVLARAELVAGALADALANAEAAAAIVLADGVQEGEAVIRLALVEARAAVGDAAGAAAARASNRAWLAARAARVAPEARGRFLGLPLHRALQA